MSTAETLQFKIAQTVHKPLNEIFAAIVDPQKLSSYFTTQSSGALEQGSTVLWQWDSESSETHVEELVENEKIVLSWQAYKVDYATRMTISFKTLNVNSTTVYIAEEGWRNDAAGRASSYEHCAGWAHMLLCLKAWLEHNIDLRVL